MSACYLCLYRGQVVCKEIEDRQAILAKVQRHGETVIPDLSRGEREALERSVQNIQVEQQKVQELSTTRRQHLQQAAQEREDFVHQHDRMLLWLQEKERLVQKAEPIKLQALDIEKQNDRYKVRYHLIYHT